MCGETMCLIVFAMPVNDAIVKYVQFYIIRMAAFMFLDAHVIRKFTADRSFKPYVYD